MRSRCVRDQGGVNLSAVNSWRNRTAPLMLPPPGRYCPHLPTPKQFAFLLCPRPEALFGGAAGPGKTEALLMGALQHVEHPGYHALLLRRTFRQLNQSNSIMNQGAAVAGEHRTRSGRRADKHASPFPPVRPSPL